MKNLLVFLIDLDNTLIDNDKIKQNIKLALQKTLGNEEAEHFWLHHNEFRECHSLVDFPNIIREYCAENHPNDCSLRLNRLFENIEVSNCIYPNLAGALNHLKQFGMLALFTEGDMIYQQMKVDKSGVKQYMDEIYIFEHKLDHLTEIQDRYKDAQIVFIDDKFKNLHIAKKKIPNIKTIWVCQGHYAKEATDPYYNKPDYVLDSIFNVTQLTNESFNI